MAHHATRPHGGVPLWLYNVGMPAKGYACIDCGEWVEKYLQPGRKKVCLECGIRRGEEHNRRMASGQHEYLERARENGREVARQIEAKSGPAYEKWKARMRQALDYA